MTWQFSPFSSLIPISGLQVLHYLQVLIFSVPSELNIYPWFRGVAAARNLRVIPRLSKQGYVLIGLDCAISGRG